jgi:dephospho-CoA kinase
VKIIGLGGGFGSGKSTVSNIFASWGWKIVDADLLAREAVQKGSQGLKEITKAFGEEFLTKEKELDRKKVAKLVFSDEYALQTLNQITHKEIKKLQALQIQSYYQSFPDAIVVYDAPLLFEVGAQKQMQKSVLVTTSIDIRIERLGKYRHYTEEEVRARVTKQMSLEDKQKLTDYTIDNDGTLEDTERQLEDLKPIIEALPNATEKELAQFI